MTLGLCCGKAVPRQGCVILHLAVPYHTMPPYATPHHGQCATLCCAWLHLAVPYPTVPHGARALLTRLGGW